jgi:hypothetical protein
VVLDITELQILLAQQIAVKVEMHALHQAAAMVLLVVQV